MNKFAIRLLTLVMFAVASVAVPMVTPSKAATSAKKKHKKMTPAGIEAQAPKASSQYPRNMSDDPDRKVSY
jgi:hypothetical protein